MLPPCELVQCVADSGDTKLEWEKKSGQEPWGPKRVVSEVRRPQERVHAPVVFVVHSET